MGYNDGSTFIITGKRLSPDLLASHLIKAYFLKDLEEASMHFNGKGIEQGIDFHSTLSLLRSHSNNDANTYSFKCALETVIAGACWPASRAPAPDVEQISKTRSTLFAHVHIIMT